MRGRPAVALAERQWGFTTSRATYDLVEPLCRTETSRTSADNENVDRTVDEVKSSFFRVEQAVKEKGSHFFLGGTHFPLQELLKTRNSLKRLAGVIEHVLNCQAASMAGS